MTMMCALLVSILMFFSIIFASDAVPLDSAVSKEA